MNYDDNEPTQAEEVFESPGHETLARMVRETEKRHEIAAKERAMAQESYDATHRHYRAAQAAERAYQQAWSGKDALKAIKIDPSMLSGADDRSWRSS